MENNGKKVFVAMSGGVDSSVAALLLKRAGYDVTGVFMRCYNLDGCAERDVRDARLVAEKLEIKFYIWDFEKEYKKRVVDYMIRGYKQGITPNPDVMCNREIKFGLFLERALKEGADYVATGHYVLLGRPLITGGSVAPATTDYCLHSRRDYSGKAGNRANHTSESFLQGELVQFGLFEAKDKIKDQSYFLWTLTQDKLRHCLFPIGNYLKSEVREIARKAGLPTADKKDSQGICFLGKITLRDFLRTYIPPKRGAVLSTAGEKIGEHDGAYYYTIGQRHIGANFQFSISNFRTKRAVRDRLPFYVAEKDIAANTLVVAEGSDNPALYKKEIVLSDVNFVHRDQLPTSNFQLPILARVRYRQPLAAATLICEDNTQTNNIERVPHRSAYKPTSVRLIFEKPQKAVAPGQSAVFYSEGGEVLGGGIIVASN